jgi:hypothetical protein
MTTTNYIQLPPDGVGKKTRNRLVTDMVMSSVANTVPTVGATIYGYPSGAQGLYLGAFNGPDASINYYVNVTTNANFAGSDGIYSAAGGTGTNYGTVAANGITANVYSPSTTISDAKIPENTLTIDSKGAAFTRFAEGTPQFDSWGHMQVSQMQAVGEYYHYAYDLAGRYYTNQVGGGIVNFDPVKSAVFYTTGTASGDIARRTSIQYHPYKPGVSQLFYTSVIIGDAGKAGVVREWGYFDDNNGFGFRLDGTTMKVFLRSDATGTVVDTEVTQANWNVNTLLSATTSEYLLDVTKANFYWMDVQGTVGRIRLGVETPDGRRITVHQFLPINNFTGSSTRILTLPVTWTQRNTSAVSSSPSPSQYFKVGAGVVFSETADIKYSGQYICITPDDPIQFNDPNNYVPFLSFKAKSTIPGPTIWANAMVANVSYTIVSNGTTNFGTLGAISNLSGQQFIANAAGSGTGTVYQNIQNSAIGIHETFDWATQGNVNLEIGIFVLPSEDYLTGYQWSDTYTSTSNVLWVDVSATAMPQVQLWSNVAVFNANIANTTMTVSSVTSGAVLKELYLRATDGSTITNKTRIIRQLTSTGPVNANTFITSGGAVGQKWLNVANPAGIGPGQLVQGANVAPATFVESIVGTNVYCSIAMTGTANVVTFSQPGSTGTYQLNNSQTVNNAVNINGNYIFKAQEAFVAPANSNGRTALGDRIEKSFGLGPNLNTPENQKGVFVFAARPQASPTGLTGNGSGLNNGNVSLWYTKFYKEIR